MHPRQAERAINQMQSTSKITSSPQVAKVIIWYLLSTYLISLLSAKYANVPRANINNTVLAENLNNKNKNSNLPANLEKKNNIIKFEVIKQVFI